MAYTIKTTKLKPRAVVAIRVAVPPARITDAFGEVLPEVLAHVERAGARPDGPPFARYFDYSEDEADFEAGYPVAKPVAGEGRVAAGELPGGRAAVTTHSGPYEGLTQAHDAVGEWVLAHGHDQAGPVWEVYELGPGDEPDPARWRTRVVWPLRR